MKIFLGTDVTVNKKNDKLDGEEFLIQKTSPALKSKLASSFDDSTEILNSGKLVLPLRILQSICGILSCICLAGILKADISMAEAYENAPWIFWLAAGCAVIWLSLSIASRIKAKSVLESEESEYAFSAFENFYNASLRELSVPEDAKIMDVLTCNYKRNGDELKPVEIIPGAQYIKLQFRVFRDDEYLYLVDHDGKYAFPLSSIVTIHTIDKKIIMDSWDKEENYDEGEYKPYKLSKDNYDNIHCKKYHILEVNHQGETLGIYIPPYELPVLEEILK